MDLKANRRISATVQRHSKHVGVVPHDHNVMRRGKSMNEAQTQHSQLHSVLFLCLESLSLLVLHVLPYQPRIGWSHCRNNTPSNIVAGLERCFPAQDIVGLRTMVHNHPAIKQIYFDRGVPVPNQ